MKQLASEREKSGMEQINSNRDHAGDRSDGGLKQFTIELGNLVLDDIVKMPAKAQEETKEHW